MQASAFLNELLKSGKAELTAQEKALKVISPLAAKAVAAIAAQCNSVQTSKLASKKEVIFLPVHPTGTAEEQAAGWLSGPRGVVYVMDFDAVIDAKAASKAYMISTVGLSLAEATTMGFPASASVIATVKFKDSDENSVYGPHLLVLKPTNTVFKFPPDTVAYLAGTGPLPPASTTYVAPPNTDADAAAAIRRQADARAAYEAATGLPFPEPAVTAGVGAVEAAAAASKKREDAKRLYEETTGETFPGTGSPAKVPRTNNDVLNIDDDGDDIFSEAGINASLRQAETTRGQGANDASSAFARATAAADSRRRQAKGACSFLLSQRKLGQEFTNFPSPAVNAFAARLPAVAHLLEATTIDSFYLGMSESIDLDQVLATMTARIRSNTRFTMCTLSPQVALELACLGTAVQTTISPIKAVIAIIAAVQANASVPVEGLDESTAFSRALPLFVTILRATHGNSIASLYSSALERVSAFSSIPPLSSISEADKAFSVLAAVELAIGEKLPTAEMTSMFLSDITFSPDGAVYRDMLARGTHAASLHVQQQLLALQNQKRQQPQVHPPRGAGTGLPKPKKAKVHAPASTAAFAALANAPAAPPSAPTPASTQGPRQAAGFVAAKSGCKNHERGFPCKYSPCPFGPAGHVSK